MRKYFFIVTFFLLFYTIAEAVDTPWNEEYNQMLIRKAARKSPLLANYPYLEYPDQHIEEILSKYPEQKVLIFSYGSLMNHESAMRTISPEALNTMQPALAFGLKRIFNYKAGGNLSRWGNDLYPNERAMLNIDERTNWQSLINGVVLEADAKDLQKLLDRETGYNLVPILIVDWNQAISENPCIKVEVAYAFLLPGEMQRDMSEKITYYPVRGYLHAVRNGASEFGPEFLDFFNSTTYLDNGATLINQWDEQDFSGTP